MEEMKDILRGGDGDIFRDVVLWGHLFSGVSIWPAGLREILPQIRKLGPGPRCPQ